MLKEDVQKHYTNCAYHVPADMKVCVSVCVCVWGGGGGGGAN